MQVVDCPWVERALVEYDGRKSEMGAYRFACRAQVMERSSSHRRLRDRLQEHLELHRLDRDRRAREAGA